jgi:cyanate permease
MEPMRAAIAALAVLGYGALAAALAVALATGDSSEVGWLLVGPLPFCVAGAIGFLRRPDNRVVWWLVGLGAAFGAQTALGDVFSRWPHGTGASAHR